MALGPFLTDIKHITFLLASVVCMCFVIALFVCLVYMCSWFAPTYIYEKAVCFLRAGKKKKQPVTEVFQPYLLCVSTRQTNYCTLIEFILFDLYQREKMRANQRWGETLHVPGGETSSVHSHIPIFNNISECNQRS